MTATRLVVIGLSAWVVMVALGVLQLLVFGEEWTRGYLDFLALVAAGALAWRLCR